MGKFSNPEKQVRAAVITAFKELDDTNAIPDLQKEVANLQDPREKVALLDAIEYIKLPNITADVPPELRTNNPPYAFTIHTNVQFNPLFMKNKDVQLKLQGHPHADSAAPPATPAPAPAPAPADRPVERGEHSPKHSRIGSMNRDR